MPWQIQVSTIHHVGLDYESEGSQEQEGPLQAFPPLLASRYWSRHALRHFVGRSPQSSSEQIHPPYLSGPL